MKLHTHSYKLEFVLFSPLSLVGGFFSLFLWSSFVCSYNREKSHYLACNVCLSNLLPFSSDPPSVKLYNNVTSNPHDVPNTQYIYYIESKNESKTELIMDIFNAYFAYPVVIMSTANTIKQYGLSFK